MIKNSRRLLSCLTRGFSKRQDFHDRALLLREVVNNNFVANRQEREISEEERNKKLNPRGRGGKNEPELLRTVVDGALSLNSNRGELNDFRTLSGPINLNGDPHLGVMANTLIRDINLRFELLKGRKIENWVCRKR
jgi:isoleucyl-tRNA synthetase